ncbi:ABC transporter ATP-binding protein [Microlunatus soli]|uniref:ABC-2 type transport system ATP-binding protein n=1 Tax=Microlunatus soli TaxID=630515 RepID=A0A1H1UG27_9ACTN|nr:ATP-binding cassette domain-containing protein [Microlunatus soli]SDS71423.1 ABC-2 type transport system ATP-binding protein [Microlunatus soli]
MTAIRDRVISVDRLTKSFRTPVRAAGLRAAATSLVRRRHRTVRAVSELSFGVDAGSVVGFIGPNGAGKTTTMKMLTGILHPTAGVAQVLGHQPHRREPEFLSKIALLRGSQPISGPSELTVADHVRYRCLLYRVPRSVIDDRIAELERVLGLSALMGRQVRGLSLGQRMRVALGLALVHRPAVIFLDEPTIGLDASAALTFRRYIAEYAATTGATVMLTSHYLTEVEALCQRILLIDDGTIRYDGTLTDLAANLSPWKELRLTLSPGTDREVLRRHGEIVDRPEPDQISLRVPRASVARTTAAVLAEAEPLDLSVVDPPLETVLDAYYRSRPCGS